MDRTEAIRRQFGAAADRYAVSAYHHLGPDLTALIDAAELAGGERALDLGTGTGHTALALAPRAAEVVAVDLTTPMLEQARRLAGERGFSNVRFELGDATALPYAGASFDLVTCRVCAHHFADAAAAMREAARVLRPGGRLLLVDSVAPEDPAEDTFLNAIELLRDPSHVRDYSVSQWRTMLADAGLAVEHLATWGVPLDFDDWVERMGTPHATRLQLKVLFDDATDQVRDAFELRTGAAYGFDIPIALLRARARGA
jgi:SAM-dependent methyltransferase